MLKELLKLLKDRFHNLIRLICKIVDLLLLGSGHNFWMLTCKIVDLLQLGSGHNFWNSCKSEDTSIINTWRWVCGDIDKLLFKCFVVSSFEITKFKCVVPENIHTTPRKVFEPHNPSGNCSLASYFPFKNCAFEIP